MIKKLSLLLAAFLAGVMFAPRSGKDTRALIKREVKDKFSKK